MTDQIENTEETDQIENTEENVNGKGFIPTILLCFFLGSLGVHRFYVGKIGTGLLMLVTLGGLGIWTLVDFIVIACSKFKDKDGFYIKS